jgi:hypothetical protein
VEARLEAFVRGGGDLLLDAGNARKLPAALTGLRLGGQITARATARVGAAAAWAEQPYTLAEAAVQGAAPVLVSETGLPVLAINAVGKGRVIVCLADNWMTDKLTYAAPDLVNMEPPYRLLDGVRAVLGEYFGSFSPVIVEPAGLNVRVDCFDGDPKRLMVALTNNDLFADWRGAVRLRQGKLASVRSLWPERAPAARQAAATAPAGETATVTVPAGDVVILDLRLK